MAVWLGGRDLVLQDARPRSFARLVLLAAAALLPGLAIAPPAAVHAATLSGNVVRVVDGDTVRVRVGGRARTFDLLGVNAPDGRQCFAAQAKRALARMLPVGSRVRVQNDPRRRGRGRYVFRRSSFVNAALLRAGGARTASLSRLSRAGALRSATRAAQRADRGLFGAACSPAPSPNAGPGPIEVADGVRNALNGKQLLDFTSTPRSSTRNTTRFCPGGRSDRIEDFTGDSPGAAFRNELTGTWAVLAAIRQADGTLVAEIAFTPDDQSFDDRIFTITVAPDGTVRRADANASELQPGGECSPSRAPPGFENDTPAARSQVVQELTGKRVDEGAAGTDDFCSVQRAVRREGGQVVVDGSWTIEWAATSSKGKEAIIAFRDARTNASRRLFVGLPATGSPIARNLGVSEPGHQVTLGSASC